MRQWVLIAVLLSIFSGKLEAQYLWVLPLPYPIDYLEKLPPAEVEELKKDEEIEESPTTEFRKLLPPDFKSQKALGYTYGETFGVPEGLKAQVDFWKKIYSKFSNTEYVIHDSKYMFIYRVVDVSDIMNREGSYRSKSKLISRRLGEHKRQIRKLLREIHHKEHSKDSMNDEEKKIYDVFKTIEDPARFLKATLRDRIRSQLGQREFFKQGIIWAGRYLPHLENIFNSERIPMEITRLPFVESSFNIKARSKVGASGIWQFIRSTGKRFLKIDGAVDERNDPIEATRAAAKLLKYNFELLQNWPLALTAYNHGPAGMARAVKKLGTTDLVNIINDYKSSTFGFASKNFYASFLGALQVEVEYEKYFGTLEPEAPMTYEEVPMKDYISTKALMNHTKLSLQELKRYNPGLMSSVFSGRKFIPKSYVLKLPQGMKETFLSSYQTIPKEWVRRNQSKQIYHRVRHGDTLLYLAKRYNTTVQAIRELNNIGKVIYHGQVLVIPR